MAPESLPHVCGTCTFFDIPHHQALHGSVQSPLPWGLCWQRIPAVLFERSVSPDTVRSDLGTETRADETCGNWTPRALFVVRLR